MPPYRCSSCGTTLFTGEGITGGRLSMPCPNKLCKTRRRGQGQKPIYQKISFDRAKERGK